MKNWLAVSHFVYLCMVVIINKPADKNKAKPIISFAEYCFSQTANMYYFHFPQKMTAELEHSIPQTLVTCIPGQMAQCIWSFMFQTCTCFFTLTNQALNFSHTDADGMSHFERSDRAGRQGQRRRHLRWSGPDLFYNNSRLFTQSVLPDKQ